MWYSGIPLAGGRDEQRALELHQSELAKLLASQQRGTGQQQQEAAPVKKQPKKPKLTVRWGCGKQILASDACLGLENNPYLPFVH